MGTSTRQRAQRKVNAAETNLLAAIKHLEEISDIYDDLHPEVSQPIMLVQIMLLECATLVTHCKGLF